MLLRATDYGRRYPTCGPDPVIGSLPPIRAHQITDRIPDRDTCAVTRERPDQFALNIVPEPDQKHPVAVLWGGVIRGFQHRPIRAESLGKKIVGDPAADFLELRMQQATDILDQNGAWSHLPHDIKHPGKEVALVIRAVLLTCHRKRWTGQTAREQIDVPSR